jgi:flagellar motility protein MotE (MotC chaperone)
MKLMITLSLILNVLLFGTSIAEDESAKDVKEPKKYTETEFKKAVTDEVLKRLKKMGSGSIVAFSKELMEKEEKIKLKELELKRRQESLDLNIKDFEKKLTAFDQRQSKLIGCMDENDQQGKKRVDHMVSVISGMKPLNAANLLSVQDSEISVKILGMLDPVKVSKIFNLMQKEISARLQKQYMTMKK